MKYLLQMTKASRSERPSEETIVSDSKNADAGKYNDVYQDIYSDLFFIMEGKPTIEMVLLKLLAAMPFTPIKLEAGEGYRVLKYPHSDKWTLAQSLRDGSKAQVQYFKKDDDTGSNEYGTAVEAMQFIATLDPSDGYVLIDEGENSQVIISRPPLWSEYAEGYEVMRQQGFDPNRATEDDRA